MSQLRHSARVRQVSAGEVGMKPILDACCGSRMFWFDRTNPDVVFMDRRKLETTLLAMKWNSDQIPQADMLRAIGCRPLFGDKRSKTAWLFFMKAAEPMLSEFGGVSQ